MKTSSYNVHSVMSNVHVEGSSSGAQYPSTVHPYISIHVPTEVCKVICILQVPFSSQSIEVLDGRIGQTILF